MCVMVLLCAFSYNVLYLRTHTVLYFLHNRTQVHVSTLRVRIIWNTLEAVKTTKLLITYKAKV